MNAPKLLAGMAIFLCSSALHSALAYSVLTHEAVIDSVWDNALKLALRARFPDATPDQLKAAHAYAYGGCIIQDLGYYPFGSHLFTDLVHYVRSADFVRALLADSRDLDEYAFALGALAHYGADIEGHSIAVNRSVPVLYPKLRRKFGPDVTYEDNPSAHLKTEFGFDVVQVARGNYAPEAYHDFIGFEVSEDLLERACEETYGLTLKDLFRTLDLSLGTYRFSVSTVIPKMTKIAWSLKRKQIRQNKPTMTRRRFLYNIRRPSFEKEWGHAYQRPGFGARLLAFLLRLVPHVGPLRALGFKVPTPLTEKMFEDSFDAAVARDRQAFAAVQASTLSISNIDLDTGNATKPGEYALADKTYDDLVKKLAEKKFATVTPALRENILAFYSGTSGARHVQPQLDALKALHTD